MVTKIRWNATDRASQALVKPMLDDMGVDDTEIREATRKWALRLINDDGASLDLTMGDLQSRAWDWVDGYEQCLCDMGKRNVSRIT